ncbi:coiled-coil domain-containing protein 181 isoform X2 [Ascaphus truei]|uniref:coiled-coil domain-containing protein 181 isoform X2 n=1 Tax=Ascaphus truei TaxID=8439 RepID=UPI003F5AC1D5
MRKATGQANGDFENYDSEVELKDVKEDQTQCGTEENGGENSQSESTLPNESQVHTEYNANSTPILKTVLECEEQEVDEEAKRYITEKIEEANKQLEKETIDEKRERKLKFKDNLVDLEVPPLEYVVNDKDESSGGEDVVDSLSQLHFSDAPQQENEPHDGDHGIEEHKDGKILVEKDGKFELINVRDIESQSFLPPINTSNTDKEPSKTPVNSTKSSVFSTLLNKDDLVQQKVSNFGEIFAYFPQPPTQPKGRPSSAINLIKSGYRMKSPRRVQSAGLPSKNTTYSLSPEQKEMQKRIQQRQDKLRKEEEERRKEEEEQKRKDNEIAFKAWLHKKKDQLLEEKRIQQAKEYEEMNNRDDGRNPSEAFKLWLNRKHKEQLRERRIDELRKQEAETYLHEREECERAFKQWLRRKRIEKRVEHQTAKEKSRRFLIEERRTKQIQNLLCSISDSKSDRFMDHYS